MTGELFGEVRTNGVGSEISRGEFCEGAEEEVGDFGVGDEGDVVFHGQAADFVAVGRVVLAQAARYVYYTIYLVSLDSGEDIWFSTLVAFVQKDRGDAFLAKKSWVPSVA